MEIRVEQNLAQRFPDKKSQIVQLEVANTDFRDLSRDYEECVRVLQRLLKDSQAEAERIDEYRDLKSALEAEALEFIDGTT